MPRPVSCPCAAVEPELDLSMASGLWQWRGGIQAAGLLQLSSIETSVSTGVGPKVDEVGVEGVGRNSGGLH